MTRRTRIGILSLLVECVVVADVAVATAFVPGWRIVFVAAPAAALVALVVAVAAVVGRL